MIYPNVIMRDHTQGWWINGICERCAEGKKKHVKRDINFLYVVARV